MNKKIVGVIGIVVVVVLGFFLFQSPNTENNAVVPSVSATVFPIYDIARTIAGDEIHVSLMLPPGASPHTFDPSPSVVRDLQKSRIVFTIGHTLDEWVEGLADQVPDIKIVTVDAGITLLETNEEHSHEEDRDEHADEEHEDEHEEEVDDQGHSHGPTDPHYWLDPRNGVSIANTIAKELSELAPEHKELFMARAELFEQELEMEIVEWKKDLAPIEHKEFITLHDAFAYLADFATLQLVATFEPFPGREPTPQYLQKLGEEISYHDIKAVFTEPQLSTTGITSFADDAGIQIGVLDPLGGVDDRTTYTKLIGYNIHELVQALQ